jgi:hypothetical protein
MSVDDDAEWERRELAELAVLRPRRPPDDEELIALHATMRDEALAALHRAWIAEGNPIHVWQAIRQCQPPAYPPCALPDWVLAYLVGAAVDLENLAHLLDPTTYPERKSGESYRDHVVRDREWRAQPPLNGTQAAARVPRVLGFTRPGWNAFIRWHAVESDASLALAERFADVPRRTFLERERQRRNLEEPGSLRRRLRRGHQRLAKG